MNLPENTVRASDTPDLVLEATRAGRGALLGLFILLDSVRWLVRRPRLLLLGMAPALLAFALVGTVLTAVIWKIRWLVDLVTPFANNWSSVAQTATEIIVGVALIAIVFALCVALFVSLSLAVGGPIYQRIWEAVEVSVHGYIPVAPVRPKAPGFWARLLARRKAADASHPPLETATVTTADAGQTAGLLVPDSTAKYLNKANSTVGASFRQGVRTGLKQAGSFLWRSSKNFIITTALSLIPVVGSIAAIAFSQQLAIWALSFELSSRSFSAHGLSEEEQTKVLKHNRPTAYGFGLATHLSFMIPLGAVLFMPAAIVGSAKLAHTCLIENPAASILDETL